MRLNQITFSFSFWIWTYLFLYKLFYFIFWCTFRLSCIKDALKLILSQSRHLRFIKLWLLSCPVCFNFITAAPCHKLNSNFSIKLSLLQHPLFFSSSWLTAVSHPAAAWSLVLHSLRLILPQKSVLLSSSTPGWCYFSFRVLNFNCLFLLKQCGEFWGLCLRGPPQHPHPWTTGRVKHLDKLLETLQTSWYSVYSPEREKSCFKSKWWKICCFNWLFNRNQQE